MSFTPSGYVGLDMAIQQIAKARKLASIELVVNYLRQAFHSEDYGCFYLDDGGNLTLVPPRIFALERSRALFSPEPPTTSPTAIGAANIFAGGVTWVDGQYEEQFGIPEELYRRRLLMLENEVRALCSQKEPPRQRLVSRATLRTAFERFVKNSGERLPGRDRTRAWAKETFGNSVPLSMVDEVYFEHSRRHPRRTGRPLGD